MHFQHFSSLSVIASLARLFATSQAVSVNPPALKLQYAWTTTALIELPGITIPIVGGNKTVYNVLDGSNFAGPLLAGTFTGIAEVNSLITGAGDHYQEIAVTVFGKTDQGVPFYASEIGRGNPVQNQLRRITIDIPGNPRILEGMFVGDLLAPPSNKLSIVTYEVVDPAITYP